MPFFLSLALFFTLSATLAKRPPDMEEHRNFTPTQSESIVFIYAKAGGSCSGFIYAENFVMTAKHCLRPNLRVVFSNQKEEPALVVKQGTKEGSGDDWAVLSVKTGDRKPVRVSRKEAELPLYTSYLSTRENLQGAIPVKVTGYAIEAGIQELLLEGQVWHGDSGSAIFDEEGRVIGLVVATNQMEQLGYASPATLWPTLP